MIKNILIFCAVLTTLSLTAFGYINWNNTVTDKEKTTFRNIAPAENNFINSITKQGIIDFVYNVDSRFINTITKEKLHNAKSIIDILPAKATKSIVSYQSAQVDIIDLASEPGNNEVLNAAQLKLLQTADYSTNIFIGANYKTKNAISGNLEDNNLTYYITVIPEKEAEFKSGREALLKYLRENSRDKTAIIKQDKLQPGRVNFTVTKEGTIANVKLSSTSGYPTVDEALIELIKDMPENWEPATNSKGEKVDQELIFFFGLQGC